MPPTYLVTGGMGFLGSFVTAALVGRGSPVIVYDAKATGNSFALSMPPELLEKVTVVEGDILDKRHLLATAKDNDVAAIVHLAAMLTTDSNANPSRAIEVNCAGSALVFDIARELKLDRVVWASSIAIYGFDHYGPDAVVTDQSPHFRDDVYGACKSFIEDIARIYHQRFGLRSTGLRFARGTGLGRQRGNGAWGRELIDKPALGVASVVPHGDELENWLSVEDQAASVVAACLYNAPDRAVFANIAGFDVRTRREAVDFVRRLLPKADIRVEPGMAGRPARYDTMVATQLLGWKAKSGMAEMLTTMIRRVRALNGLPDITVQS